MNMKKKNNLLAVTGLAALSVLFAFTYPATVQEHVLTLFFPEGALPVAPVQAPEDLEVDNLLTAFVAPDTNPPLQERYDDFLNNSSPNVIDLKDPKVIEQQVEYDPETNMYIITEKIGDDFFRAPTYMTFAEYTKWRDRKQQEEYFDRLQGVTSTGDKSSSGIVDPIAKFNIKNSLIDRLFGGTTVDIRPQGNINLTFGYQYQRRQNPILTLRQQGQGNFDFDMDINMSATGKIGEKLNLNFNYNTQATFDFDNQMKLDYDTKGFSEDEIIQGIEAGNVSLPLRSNLIKGAQNLFGIRMDLKFGHLRATLLAAQQRSKQQNLAVQGGSQIQAFEKPIDEYDENRHFFLSQWNRREFEPALRCLPVPLSLFTITRLEVWITNDKLVTENTRDIVALADLAEPMPFDSNFKTTPIHYDIKNQPLPDNDNNSLYPQIRASLIADPDTSLRQSAKVVGKLTNEFELEQIKDFEKVRARLLSPAEYTYNDQLGFVSLNLNVQPDQVVGLAVEYTYNGQPHKIGEFASDVQSGDSLNQNVLFVKMLKSTTANVKYPIWDLMMKNIYAIGSANVDPQEFRFDIFYENPGEGQKRFLSGNGVPQALQSKTLLQVFNLDMLNLQQDPGPDGIFDFVPGVTINLRSGRVMFPVLEPFGSFLNNRLLENGADTTARRKFVYQELYDSTLFRAREFQQFNRFTLKGTYKSATSAEISLGTFNLPQGSVRVSAGGRQLIEGQDYSVDYNIGKVRILNDAILQSGQNVSVSFEDNSLFGFQSRSMVGARLDYDLSKDVRIGGTFMNLFERPLTQKVNFGDDPINNKVYGLDFNISKDAPWITKFVDWLPLLETKEKSSITAQAEVALLDPGHNRAINQGGDKGGTVYLDDFEGSTSNLRVDFPANSWVISSVPRGDSTLFPESTLTDDIRMGTNRARLSWYNGDSYVRNTDDNTNPYTLTFNQQDIFPNRQLSPAEQSILRGLDVTYFPRERGPYNFETPDGYPGISKGFTSGIADDGEPELDRPETRWAGFMKGLNTNDFEAANIEFVEFWMLNPYMDPGNGKISKQGNMYIDLGSVSEDIMRDSRQFFENAIPTGQGTGATVSTRLGRIPVLPPVVNAFDNDPAKRVLQDVGLDGLNDDDEKAFFADWVNTIMSSSLSPNAKNVLLSDPSADNFVYFGDARFQDPNPNPGLIERYRRFNSTQGNSPVNTNQGVGGLFNNPSATNIPDGEDLNRDNSLNESESYYRYKIPLIKRSVGGRDELDITSDSLKDLVTEQVTVNKNGQEYIWYRFKIPLDAVTRQQIGGIQDFRSIRFMRMLWQGFDERTTFRFATLELGRNQWRRFTQPLPRLDGGATACDVGFTRIPFDVNAVSIEENAARQPFNYTIPFGISREQSVGAFPEIQQNEQALSLNVCDLVECDARGIFKSLNLDLRQYDRLKMFVHGEGKGDDVNQLDSTDLTVFLRLGSDFVRNYYEYEINLVPSKVENLNGNPDSRDYKEEVWKPQNNFDFPLDLLIEAKKQRNADPNATFDVPFVISDPDRPNNKVKVVGNPNLGYVKGVMVGVRNVDQVNRDKHCAEIWINELRLSGFNEQGGYAGQARVDMKLADFGNISLAGNYSSIGWGTLEQKLVQRQREEIIQYDFSTNLELGKLLPEKVGLRIPFYAQYTNVTRNPEYDPYDLDIKLKDKIRDESDAAKKQEIRTLAQDVTIVRGFNFTNVRKERRGKGKPMPWDISNFSVTYAFNQERSRDPFTIRDDQNRYKGSLDYQYATGIQPIQPFKGVNNKYLKFIKEFNFNPLPNTYGFNTILERYVGVRTDRFAGEDPKRNTYYNRRFTWDRNYDLGWDITRALRFNFDANARSIIDEPMQYHADGREVSKAERRDSIMKNMRTLGRPKGYTHNASLNYTLPFKYFPFLEFITMKASYTAGYTWTAQSLKLQNLDAGIYQDRINERNLGNTIQNTNVRQINGEFNLETLYNKSKYLGRINKPGQAGNSGSGGRGRTQPNRSGENPGELPGGLRPEGGLPGDRGGRPGDPSVPGDGKDKRTPGNPANPTDPSNPANPADRGGLDPRTGAPRTGEPGGRDPGKATDGKANPSDPNAPAGKGAKTKKEKVKKERQPSMAERIALRPLMLVRRARFTYSENFSTVVPGFTPEPKLMGLSEGFLAPGWQFVAGIQPETSWLDEAARNGWITHRPELNQQVLRNYTQNIDASVAVEPFADFKIEITATKQYTRNSTELFKDQNFLVDPNEVDFQHRAQRDFGSYTISYFALNTLFSNDIDGLFARFKSYRPIISERLAATAGDIAPHQEDDGYKKGYGKFQQEVLLPAFLAAYTEKDPNTVGLKVFRTRPAVNWKLNYAGLSKVGNLKKVFSSFTITHGYRSTLTLNSFNTDIFYDPQQTNKVDELNFNYIARYEIPQVVINEQFQPLLGVQMKMKNGMSLNLDFKKSRTLAMSFVDYQLAEGRSTGYSGEFGYLLKNVNIPFLTNKKSKKSSKSKSKKKAPVVSAPPGSGGAQQSNDMNFKFTFEYRDDITVNHQLDQREEAVPTRGSRTVKISPSVDYALNKRLSLRVFTDYSKTVPKTSQSFPITTVSAGVTVQFKLN